MSAHVTVKRQPNCRIEIRDRLLAVLSAEQEKRPDRPGLTWMDKELLAMWAATNEERARLGKGPAALDLISTCDRCASGHVDYSRKFALYCAEIVLDQSPFQKPEESP